MNSEERENDDLTIIKGIGPTRELWFRESLGVRTYRDLASRSPVQVLSLLKADGQIASLEEVEAWIARAWELSDASETEKVTMNEGAAEMEEAETWEWLKAFVVEFCVLRANDDVQKQELRVYPLKVSEKGDWLDNGEPKRSPRILQRGEQLYAWMVEQLAGQPWHTPDETLPKEPEGTPEEEPKEAPRKAEQESASLPNAITPSLKVAQLSVYQPPRAGAPTAHAEMGQPFAGFVTGHNPFAVEVELVIGEPTEAELTGRQFAGRAFFYVRNMSGGLSTSLGDAEFDVDPVGAAAYDIRLPVEQLAPGTYHLGVQVTLRTRPPVAEYIEAPYFRVL